MKGGLLSLLVLFTAGVNAAATPEDEIRERIKPVGAVCVEGQDCGSAAAAAPTGPRSGDQVYTAVCAACHGTGAMGAPKLGDAAAWTARAAQGVDTLVSHAINGINMMPAKGGCAACSDDEIKAAVQHMLDNSK